MTEFETRGDAHGGWASNTDGLARSGDAGHTSAVAQAAAPKTQDFDHRLVFANVSMALFGAGEILRIGKYRVERRIGEGGMGEVYLCDDGDLGRKVAVKRVLGLGGSARAHERLRREARALARLSHPNVVQVYESGVHEGRTYLAMEYIEGQTLREWMDEGHPWREILQIFIAAGRGLAAAHEAGLVHRDFKPENVLIGRDGVARVADFGLALGDGLRAPNADRSEAEVAGEIEVSERLTALGSAAGTRQYMPLEQILGRPVDARSDQFAFCTSLYEALWGERPYTHETLGARAAALRAGAPKTPSSRRDLYRVIRRGLEREPEARWPSMDALLHALERVPRRRRWLAWGGAVGLSAGLAVIALPMLTPPVERCPAIATQLDGVWDSERQAALERHFAALEAPHLAASRARVFAGLADWSRAWVGERRETCELLEATAGDPGRHAEARARDACLTRQRREVSTLVNELGEGDADTLARGVVALAALPAPSSCAHTPDVDELEPLSPATEAQVEELRAELERAHQLRLLGERERARTLVAQVEDRARALDYAPLLARVLGERAAAEEEGGAPQRADELYLAAVSLAEQAGRHTLAASLLLERAELSAFELADPVRAATRYEWLEVASSQLAPDARREAGLALGRGRLAELAGETEVARKHYEEAISLAGEDALQLPEYLDRLARVVEPEAELELRRRAYAVASERLGPLHPRTASHMRNYGIALAAAGDSSGAELRARAAELLAQSGAAPDRALAEFDFAARALHELELDQAAAHARALAELQDEFLPPGHPDRGRPEQLLGTIEGARGNPSAAIEHARAALDYFEAAPGARPDARTLSMRSLLANQLMNEGELGEAEELLDSLVDEASADPLQTAVARLRLAEIALRRADLDEADAQLRACAGAGLELGAEQLGYALLRAVVSLRRGELTPQQVAGLAQARARYPAVDRQLPAWLDQLAIGEEERRALELLG